MKPHIKMLALDYSRAAFILYGLRKLAESYEVPPDALMRLTSEILEIFKECICDDIESTSGS
jgi:hypothetical protein